MSQINAKLIEVQSNLLVKVPYLNASGAGAQHHRPAISQPHIVDRMFVVRHPVRAGRATREVTGRLMASRRAKAFFRKPIILPVVQFVAIGRLYTVLNVCIVSVLG